MFQDGDALITPSLQYARRSWGYLHDATFFGEDTELGRGKFFSFGSNELRERLIENLQS